MCYAIKYRFQTIYFIKSKPRQQTRNCHIYKQDARVPGSYTSGTGKYDLSTFAVSGLSLFVRVCVCKRFSEDLIKPLAGQDPALQEEKGGRGRGGGGGGAGQNKKI